MPLGAVSVPIIPSAAPAGKAGRGAKSYRTRRKKAALRFSGVQPKLSKKLKSVAVGGHAPTTATPPGKFCGKLCARSCAPSARFAVKFCRRLRSRAPPAADAARRSRGSGRRMQAPFKARRMMRAPQPGHTQGETATLGNCRARLLPLVKRVEFLDTLTAPAAYGPGFGSFSPGAGSGTRPRSPRRRGCRCRSGSLWPGR